eukprot:jgi/Psemu1/67869/estExt_Genemark1.C_3830012
MAFHLRFYFATALLLTGLALAQETISTEEFKAGVDNGSYDLILDVRSRAEWDLDGHIPGAILVPMEGFADNAVWANRTTLTSTSTSTTTVNFSCDRACAKVVIYCSVGGRATKAIRQMRETLGFEGSLYNGQGTTQWVAAGYDLTTDEESPEPACLSTDICPVAEQAEETTAVPVSSSPSSMCGVGAVVAALTVPVVLAWF